MALIFPKSTDKYVRIGAGVLALLALGGVSVAMYIGYPTVIMTGYRRYSRYRTATNCTQAISAWIAITATTRLISPRTRQFRRPKSA